MFRRRDKSPAPDEDDEGVSRQLKATPASLGTTTQPEKEEKQVKEKEEEKNGDKHGEQKEEGFFARLARRREEAQKQKEKEKEEKAKAKAEGNDGDEEEGFFARLARRREEAQKQKEKEKEEKAKAKEDAGSDAEEPGFFGRLFKKKDAVDVKTGDDTDEAGKRRGTSASQASSKQDEEDADAKRGFFSRFRRSEKALEVTPSSPSRRESRVEDMRSPRSQGIFARFRRSDAADEEEGKTPKGQEKGGFFSRFRRSGAETQAGDENDKGDASDDDEMPKSPKSIKSPRFSAADGEYREEKKGFFSRVRASDAAQTSPKTPKSPEGKTGFFGRFRRGQTDEKNEEEGDQTVMISMPPTSPRSVVGVGRRSYFSGSASGRSHHGSSVAGTHVGDARKSTIGRRTSDGSMTLDLEVIGEDIEGFIEEYYVDEETGFVMKTRPAGEPLKIADSLAEGRENIPETWKVKLDPEYARLREEILAEAEGITLAEIIAKPPEKVIFEEDKKDPPSIPTDDSYACPLETLSSKPNPAHTVAFSFEEMPELELNELLEAPEEDRDLSENLQSELLAQDGCYTPEYGQKEFEEARSHVEKPVDFVPHRFTLKQIRGEGEYAANEKYITEDYRKGREAASSSKVAFVLLQNLDFSAKNYRKFAKRISQFENCEALIIQSCRLKSLEDLVLPNLLYCDLRYNEIADYKSLLTFVDNCPKLQMLDLTENPVTDILIWHSVSMQISAKLPDLRMFNGSEWTLLQRRAAVLEHGTKEQVGALALEVFDGALSATLNDLNITTWQPSLLTELNLSNLSLEVINVTGFNALQTLDVSYNHLSTIAGCGIEFLTKLVILNVQSNELGKNLKNDIKVISHLDSIQHVIFAGNAVEKNNGRMKPTQPEAYRSRVIYAARNSRGSKYFPGLVSLDGELINMEERLSVEKKFNAKKKKKFRKKFEVTQWEWAAMASWGHVRLNMVADAYKRLRTLSIDGKILGFELEYCDVSTYANLEILHLPNHNFSEVIGLKNLKKLRLLDVSGNSEVDLPYLFTDLSELENLEALAFGDIGQKVDEGKMFHRALQSLLFQHGHLHTLNGRPISLRHRFDTHKLLPKPEIPSSHYLLLATILTSVTPVKNRSYLPADVVPGVQYKAEDVKYLVHLDNLGINALHAGFSFSMFTNLEKINLSKNKITDPRLMELDQCPRLRELDLHHNSIDLTTSDLAVWIESLKELEVICLRKNPCMKSSDSRLALIYELPSLRKLGGKLRVIDTAIDVLDRVDARKKHQEESEKALEQFKFSISVEIRRDTDLSGNSLAKVDLSEMHLTILDFKKMSNLTELYLQKNDITTLDSASGFSKLTSLVVLDARQNKIEDMTEFFAIIRRNPNMRAIGMADNPFSQGKRTGIFGSGGTVYEYRAEVIKELKELRKVGYKLRYIDEEEILADEIITAWKYDVKSKNKAGEHNMTNIDFEKFRWDLALFRYVDLRVNKAEGVKKIVRSYTRFAAEGKRIELPSFEHFKKLESVSLKDNRIRVEALDRCDLDKLKGLSELDIRGNELKDKGSVVGVIGRLRKLESLFIEENPFFDTNSSSNRVSLLKYHKDLLSLDMKLKYLNGDAILPQERFDAAEDLKEHDRYNFLLSLILQYLNADYVTTSSLNLSHLGLKYVSVLGNPPSVDYIYNQMPFLNLKYLDLSHNRLSSLDGNALDSDHLPNLEYLDLRYNCFSSIDSMMPQLRRMNHLKQLFLRNSVVNRAGAYALETRVRRMYFKKVCYQLRGLEKLDGKKNPYSLSKEQWEAVRVLEEVANVGANMAIEMDLRDRNLGRNDFGRALKAIRALPVVNLYAAQGNSWQHVDKFRFYMIYYIDTLMELDGIQINMIERANAATTVKKAEKTYDVFAGKEKYAALAMSGGVWAFLCPCCKSDESKDEAGVDMNAIPKPSKSTTGLIMTKIEIFVSFLQIHSLILNFDFEWPESWKTAISWIWVFSFDVDVYLSFSVPYLRYTKFGIWMIIPLMFFFMYRDFNKRTWRLIFRQLCPITFCFFCLLPLVVMFVVVVGGYALDWYIDGGNFDNLRNLEDGPQGVMLTVFVAVPVLLCIFYCCLVPVWMKDFKTAIMGSGTDNLLWWFRFMFYKKRFSLFALTLLYMPVCKQILSTFLEKTNDNGECVLKFYEDLSCPDTVWDWHPIQWVAVFFFILYGLGIPVFFMLAINKAVKLVDIHMNRKGKLGELKDLKKQVKKEKDPDLKKKLKKDRKDLKKLYAQTCGEYDMAQVYLFLPYGRRYRFFKPFLLIEKLLLVALALFFGAQAVELSQMILGNVVIAFFFLLHLFTLPYNDWSENLMDTFGRFVNTANVLIGIINTTSGGTAAAAATFLFGLNGANAVVTVVSVVANPFRWVWGTFKYKRELKAAIKAYRDMKSNLNAMGDVADESGAAVGEGVRALENLLETAAGADDSGDARRATAAAAEEAITNAVQR